MSNHQYSEKFIKFCVCIFCLLEVAWSCSAWGYIRIGTFSMSFIPVIVIVGAYLFGGKAGVIAGFLFGFTSMLVATINAGGIPADAIFSPFNSGRPLQSIILCYGPRIIFGLIAGVGFQLVKRKKLSRWKLVGVTFIALYAHAFLVYTFAAAMFPEIISWDMLLSLVFLDINKILELVIPCLILLGLVQIQSKPSVQAYVDQTANGYDKLTDRRKIIRYSALLMMGFLITISGIFIEFVVFVRIIFSGNESSLSLYQQSQVELLALQQVIGSAAFVLFVLGLGVFGYCYFLSKELQDKERIQREMVRTELARKEAEEATKISTALANDFLNVFLINPVDGMARTIKLNGYATTGMDLTGKTTYPFQELVQTYARERVYGSDKQKIIDALSPEGIQKNLQQHDEFSMSYQVKMDETMHYYQMKIIKIEGENYYVLAFQNIDSLMQEEMLEQKRYEEALIAAQKASRAKTDFLSRMSHDIRTPINGIVGMAHIMESQSDDPEKVLSGIDSIKKLSQQLESLVNDVLEMSRIESGKLRLQHETFHLPSILRAIAPSIQVMAEARSVILSGSHYLCKHESVTGSPVHIQRIISNILSNAVKYNHPGGTVECWLEEEPIDEKHSTFTFTVKDTGIGMSQEFLDHIFEPFNREHSGTDTYYSGTGLGMTITKELVDKLGGTIAIDSKKGVGTTVVIKLPFELGEEIKPEPVNKPNFTLDGKRVLVVEDNKVNRKIAKFILEEQKAVVDTAVNGKDAVDKFNASKVNAYDLILMDLMMPVMNGLDATRAIRALDRPDAKTVPIVAMTANAFEEDVQNCLEAGMNAHIAKPINIPVMMEQIEKTLRK